MACLAFFAHFSPALSALARQAATELSGEANHPDADIGVQLLRDIKALWPEDQTFLTSQELLRHLHDLEDQPWATWCRGNVPMTPHALARLLKEFWIKSKSNGQIRGYQREYFQDAFIRHNVLGGDEQSVKASNTP